MAVGLQLATKNSFVRVQEDINDNLTKLDEAIDFNLLATLGIEYGGILNNTNAKTSGEAYYDTTGKKLYKCIANTSINYADAGYFEALSNNDLLGKLQNLTKESSTALTVEANFRYAETLYASVFRKGYTVTLVVHDVCPINTQISVTEKVLQLPFGFRPAYVIECVTATASVPSSDGIRCILGTDGTLTFIGAGSGTVPMIPHTLSLTFFTTDN